MHSSVAIDQREDKDSVLISSDIGNQVSSSFDQLAKALQESDNRSIDQLSIEVLRPMLREWLDDNLPGIVERLVREEIERIARGPSRS
ncbi:PopZ family protein [Candidatus Liberibacter solanacearum]